MVAAKQVLSLHDRIKANVQLGFVLSAAWLCVGGINIYSMCSAMSVC